MKAMAEKLKDQGRAGPYRLRKQVVEPVLGQIKQARGFRQFLLRNLDKVRGEWAILCTVHNLLKLAAATTKTKAAAALDTKGSDFLDPANPKWITEAGS